MTFSTAVSPGEQVEVLEDVADRPASHPRPIRARDGREVDAVDEHLAAGRLLEAAGDRQQRALARAARPHDGDQLAPLDRQVDVAQRAYLGRAGAVDLRYLAQFECAGHRGTSIARSLVRGPRRPPRPVRAVGRCFKRTSAASSQRTIASSRKSSASATSASAVSSSRGRRLDLGVALHDLDHVPAMHLHELVHVGPGDLQRDQHLDHELVARRRHELGRRTQPARPARGRPLDVIR